MTRIFFVEKPSQAKDISRVMNEGDVAIICPSSGGYRFKYPKNISYKEIPKTFQFPKYKISKIRNQFTSPIKELKNGMLQNIENQFGIDYYTKIALGYRDDELKNERKKLAEYIQSFEEILIATNQSHSGTRGFDLFIELYLDCNIKSFHNNITRLNFSSLDKKSLAREVKNGEDINSYDENTSPKYDNQRSNYKNKDFFDYNFNINSLMILNDCLKEAGLFASDFLITHFTLKTLLLFTGNETKEERAILKEMDVNGIGRIMSRGQILKSLFEAGILIKQETFGKDISFLLSKEGVAFLNMIHPKINSLNTDVILKDFEELDHMEFKRKYTIKLETYFKKQRNSVKRLISDIAE